MEQIVFDIEGMYCTGCAETVHALIASEPGVQRVAVSYERRQVRVLFDARVVSIDALVDVVARAGYRLRLRGR